MEIIFHHVLESLLLWEVKVLTLHLEPMTGAVSKHCAGFIHGHGDLEDLDSVWPHLRI